MTLKDTHYSQLASDIRLILRKKKFLPNDIIYTDLVLCEEAWRDLLLSTKHGIKIYEKFIHYIINVKQNILDARPFFRIKQSEYITKVNPFIRNNNPKPLTKLRINSTFITFVMEIYKGPHKKALNKLSNKINELRKDFLIRNFPLILNRIKLIYHTSNMEIQDLVAIASSAALLTIDKFAPTIKNGHIVYTSVILSSIIRRITAAVDQTIDSQQLHLYPSDRKILIEIARLKKEGLTDLEVSDKVNVSEYEISRFENGVSIESYDENVNQLESHTESVDETVSMKEQKSILAKHLDILTVFERKILKLKGML